MSAFPRYVLPGPKSRQTKICIQRISKVPCYFFLALLLSLQTALVRAQGNNEKLHVLINRGVIERRVGEVDRALTSSANSVIRVDRFRNSLTRLPEILEQEVGVQTRSSGGIGSLSTVVLRGASADQVIIYLDGVPLNNASGSMVDVSLIPPGLIERIDIYRGSTPLELGDPSIGGAINIITRQSLQTNSESTANISTGSFHTYKAGASSMLTKGRDSFLVSGSYLQSKNNFSFVNNNGTPLNPNDDRVEERNNDGVKHLALLTNWKHKFSQQYDTEVRVDMLDRHKELPSVTNSADVQTFIDTFQVNFLSQINAHSFMRKNLDANVKLFSSIKNELFDDSLAQLGFINQRTKSITRKTGAELFLKFTQHESIWKLLNNISIENYNNTSILARVNENRSNRKRLELSAENSRFYDSNKLILNLVLRYQSVLDNIVSTTDIAGNPVPGFDKNYQFLDPQLGMRYRFSQHTYLTANIGQYSRVPSFLELFGGGGLLLSNPDLKPETSVNTDVGFTYTWYKPYHWFHNAELYTGLFYNRIQNLIVRIYNGQGLGKSENVSNAQINGFEGTLKLHPAAHNTLNFSLTLLNSTNFSTITSFKGKALPGYYQQSFGVRYALRVKHWLYRIDADIKRTIFYDRSNLLKGDNVNLINIGLRYYSHKANIDLMANNLLNENIRYFRNRPTPGRAFFITYNHSF